LKKILWLASWYPNKLDQLSGDFIERHAKSASILNSITVIHVVKDYLNITEGRRSTVKKRYQSFPDLTAYLGYYKSSARGFFSFIMYFRFQKRLIDQYIKENGKPDLINVHISFKAGLGALYCKWKYGIRYIVSEHWTIFCPEAKPSFNDQSLAARSLMKRIYKNAEHSSAVSNYLAQSLTGRFNIKLPVRIPNVVDTKLFYPSDDKHEVFTFIHVSLLNFQKSPFEIIEAIKILRDKSSRHFKFIIYGPSVKEIYQKINLYNLGSVVDYRPETSQDVLSAEVRKSHALLLYSRFETFGCVIIEAFASGLPVVVSDIPVMRELVEENVSGIFAPVDQPEKLADKMLWMMENYGQFNGQLISTNAGKKFSFEKVAELFDDFFSSTSSPTLKR